MPSKIVADDIPASVDSHTPDRGLDATGRPAVVGVPSAWLSLT